MSESSKPDTPAAASSRGAVSWDASEFAAQFIASFRTLWLIAVGIVRDTSLAEDVVQEAGLIALRKIDDFEPGTNFVAWMGRTVRFVALNQARRERRRKAFPLDPDAAVAPLVPSRRGELGPRGELAPDQEHFDDEVLQALGRVSRTARACLLLRTVGGLEYSEISDVLGIPAGTAMSHVHRTRQSLRNRLGAYAARSGFSS